MSSSASQFNPYDPKTPNYNPSTPSAHDVIAEAVRQSALHLRVCVPARVTAVHSAQTVSLQPLVSARYVGDVTKPLPIIPDAHVLLLHGATWGMTSAPVAVGDLGIALFADRNLGPWAASDGTQPLDPNDGRAHHLSDAFFFPGAVPTAIESKDMSGHLVLKNGPTQLRIGPSGFALTNGTYELVALVQALAGQVQSLAQAVAGITSGGFSVDFPSKTALAAQAAKAAALAGQAKSLTNQ